ncbi:MAG: oligosaccharide flippase family protein [Massiliimalia sp.]
MRKVRSFLVSMILLTATTLLIRTIGISFTAYLSQKIGPSGIGIYQLILSVSSLAITLATSGVKFTAIRLVSEQEGMGSASGQKAAVKRCLCYALAFSLSALILLFFGADLIGRVWLSDERTIPSLKLLAFSLPFTAVSAVMNGYFTAVRKTGKSAVIQIFDQLAMIGFTLIGLHFLLPYGFGAACLALVGSSCLSEMVTCLLLTCCWLWEKRHLKGTHSSAHPGMSKKMLKIALPIAFSSYARSGLSTIQHLLVPRGLSKSGSSKEEAFASYGMVHGMVLPLVLYPAALMITLADLLVPELTECQVKHRQKQIDYMATRVFRLSLIFAVATAGTLFCFSSQLGTAVYQRPEAGFYIRIFAPLVLIMYMDTVVDGVLKGMGEQFNSMKYNVIDSFSSVLLVWLLIPKMGVKGYIITVMVSEVLNFCLSLNRLIHITHIRLDLWNSLIKPLGCIVISIAFIQVFFRGEFFGKFCPQFLPLQIAAFLGIYILCMLLTSSLSRQDVRWIFSTGKAPARQ